MTQRPEAMLWERINASAIFFLSDLSPRHILGLALSLPVTNWLVTKIKLKQTPSNCFYTQTGQLLHSLNLGPEFASVMSKGRSSSEQPPNCSSWTLNA